MAVVGRPRQPSISMAPYIRTLSVPENCAFWQSQVLNLHELHKLWEALKLSRVNKYTYMLTSKGLRMPGSEAWEHCSSPGGFRVRPDNLLPFLLPMLTLRELV
jgi:hypothetical protein